MSDKSGAIVQGAGVTATNTGTNLERTAKTNAQGEYRIDFLPIGEYNVAVSAAGFKKFLQKGITLEVNVTARVDAPLEVGSLTEEVNVTAAPPQVNTSNAEIGRSVGMRLYAIGANGWGTTAIAGAGVRR